MILKDFKKMIDVCLHLPCKEVKTKTNGPSPGLRKGILESTAISAVAAGARSTLAERTAVSGCLTSLSKTLDASRPR